MQYRNQSTRERILSAAEKLFAEKGYKETTTREIVREAGASLSSLQAHFQGKDNVYFQVRCRAIEELYQFMRPSIEEVEYMNSQGLLKRGDKEWCFDARNLHAIILVGREMLDGSPVQDLPEEKIEAILDAIQQLCLRYVGAEDGDWAHLLGRTLSATMMGMTQTSHRDTQPEAANFKLLQSQAQVKYQVKSYILLSLRAYLDILRTHPQEGPPWLEDRIPSNQGI